MASAAVRRMSTAPTHITSFPTSLEWVKAGCPPPHVLEAAAKPATLAMPEIPAAVPVLMAKAVNGPAPFMVVMAGVAGLFAKFSSADPLKDEYGQAKYIMVEGRMELKPPPEEDEEEDDGPKEFELSDDGKRYGGAFVAHAERLKKFESTQ